MGGRHPAWCGDRTALPSDTRFVYVLEGKVVLELDGKTPQTFTAGQAFVATALAPHPLWSEQLPTCRTA